MEKRTYYTAVGRFVKQHDADGNTYPVVYVSKRENMLDLQEMAVWTALNWRLADFRQLEYGAAHFGELPSSVGGTRFGSLWKRRE